MSYTDETIRAVWEKAKSVDNNDSTLWRKDECGAWIQRTMYGDRSSGYGWEIDHILPQASDDISNLCPLHWKHRIGFVRVGWYRAGFESHGQMQFDLCE